MLLLCHRLKKWWKSAVRSNAARGYQETRTEPSLSIQEYPEDFSTTIECTRPSDSETLLRQRRYSFDKLSTKLRKRLSRKSRLFRVPSRKNHKRDVRSLFSSESPSIVLTPAPFCDFGSSLMSERGYDSDAQFVPTPKRASQSPGHPPASASTDQGLQHTKQDNHDLGLSVLSEQSHDLVGSDFDNFSDKELLDFEMDEPRSESVSLRATRHSLQTMEIPTQSGPTGYAVDHPTHDERGEQPTNFRRTDLSTPLSNNMSESSDRDLIVSQQAQELGFVPMCTGARLPSTASSDSSNEHMPEITIEKRRKQVQHRDSVPTSIDERLASTGSSNTSNEHMSEIIVEKTRQRSSPEVRLIHLCDLNIPKALASPSITPRNMSQSFGGNRQQSTHSSRSASDQDDARIWQRNAEKSSLAAETVSHGEYISSVYSKRSISSAGISSDYLRPNASRFSSTSCKPTDSETECLDPTLAMGRIEPTTLERNPECGDDPITANEYRKGIFTERFDLEGSLPLDAQSLYGAPGGEAVPRRISIGWMSGGRRLGYGYTMVDSNEESSSACPEESNSFLQNARDRTSSDPTLRDEPREHIEQQPITQEEETSPKSGGALPNVHETTHHVRQRRWSGATTVLRKAKSKESMESASTMRSLWSKLAGRARKDRAQTPDNASASDRNPWSNSESPSITGRECHMKTLSLFGRPTSKRKATRVENRYTKDLQLRPRDISEAGFVHKEPCSVGSQHPVIQTSDIEENGHLNNERQEDVGQENTEAPIHQDC